MKVYAVDLFCGAGGLTHGLELEGIRVRYGLDLDPLCEYAYEANNSAKFLERDIGKLCPTEIEGLFPKSGLSLLVGCAPCQSFSTYTQGLEDHRRDDWKLLDSFVDIIKHVQPDLVSMENVPRLAKQDVYGRFVRRLRRAGYSVRAYRVECEKYGVPQYRRRLVLLASRFGPVELERPTHESGGYRTVRDLIDEQSALEAGEASASDPLHRASGLSDLNLSRIRASTPGGSWRDWPKRLVAKCHKASTGSKYPSIYGRMEWDRPAPTITTECYQFGSGRFGHPEQDRALSLREAALLQTFPADYEFLDPDEHEFSFKGLGRLIGNAVPVEIGRTIGRSILNHIEEYDI